MIWQVVNKIGIFIITLYLVCKTQTEIQVAVNLNSNLLLIINIKDKKKYVLRSNNAKLDRNQTEI